MEIGKVIKKLRRENELTQEVFAETLGVTPQAVSRWENGAAYPDLGTIPAIARYFGVTTDLLLGVDADRTAEEVEAILAEYKRLQASGEQEKRFALIRAAKENYPGEWRILSAYAWELYASPYHGPFGETDLTPDEIRAVNEEVLAIGERILAECTDDDIRYSTLDLMSKTYMDLDDIEKSKVYARRLPGFYQTAPMTLYCVQDTASAEDTHFRQEHIMELCDLLWLWIRAEAWVAEPEKRIALCSKALAIYETLYEAGDYGYANEMVSQIYKVRACAYLALGENACAMDDTEAMVRCKVRMDELNSGLTHTSMLFDTLVFEPAELTRSFTCSNAAIALDWIRMDIFKPLMETERYTALVAWLETRE